MGVNLERGAASLNIGHCDGTLTVKHGSDRTTLLEGDLPEGGWDKIIEAILAAAPNATGPMRSHN